MRWVRLLLITLILAFAVWAALAERHAVRSFAGPEVRILPGMAVAEGTGAPWWPGSWCEAAATDALVRRGDDLFHLATLAPELERERCIAACPAGGIRRRVGLS